MAKTLDEKPITTPTARSKLPLGIFWRGLDNSLHLGYRHRKNGGEWLVRWRHGSGYRRESIGTADDFLTADGQSTFNFDQAVAEARRIADAKQATALVEAAGPVPTTRSAIVAYLAVREATEREQKADKPLKRDARSRLTKHVLTKPLAEKPLHELDDEDLKAWRRELEGLAVSTVRRLVNDLKAALNKAADDHRKTIPNLPGVIKAGFKSTKAAAPVARQVRPLADEEVRAVLKAAEEIDKEDEWEGDLYRMVLILAATGARFGQVAAIRVGDVETASKLIMVPVSHKGRGEKQRTSYPVQVSDDVLKALKPAIAKRKTTDILLERWRYRQTGPVAWVKDRRGPWQSASEITRPWAKIREKAELAADAVPYVLRHSSIIRGLRIGLPVRLVASLHDTSTKMIESHYARWIADTETEIARRAILAI